MGKRILEVTVNGQRREDAVADTTLLLPTRRATRVMQEAFLEAAGGRAMTLPQIRPISASEEDANLLAGLASPGTLGTDALDLAPAVSEIERRLVERRNQQGAVEHPALAVASPD